MFTCRLAQSVKLMIAIAILLTYTLQFYVPMGIIWRNCQVWFPHWGCRAEYSLRITLIVVSGNQNNVHQFPVICNFFFFAVGIACAFPKLGPFISLVGAVCLSTLGLMFPAIIETITYWDEPGMGRLNWRLCKNVFLVTFGILGFVTGTWSSLYEMFHSN